MRRTLTVLGISALIGCSNPPASNDGGSNPGDGGSAVDAPAADSGPVLASATARFDVPGTGAPDYWALPFPHDLFLGPDGTVDVGEWPTTSTMWASARQVLEARRGFGTTSGVHFPIDGELNPASVPAPATPTSTARATDAIVFVDVDAASPERGRFIPVDVEYARASARSPAVLHVRPVRGVVLARNRTYAVALTNTLLGMDGTFLRESETFTAAKDWPEGGGPGADRARPIIQPVTRYLETLGVSPSRIVALSVFKTWDPMADLLAVRDAEDADLGANLPRAVVERVYDAAAMDDVFGIPSVDRPGSDVPPAAGQMGTSSIRHSNVALLVTGRFTAPRLVEGSGTEIGFLRRGPDGRLAPGPRQDVPFVLMIPKNVSVVNMPIIVGHHGLGSNRQGLFAYFDTAARAGAAMLAYDAYQHGSRSATAVDLGHDSRGSGALLGPDGFSESGSANVVGRLLGFEGANDADLTAHPGFGIGAIGQMVGDLLAAIRFVADGDVSAIAAADPSLAGLSFDDTKIGLLGYSLGTMVGTAALAVDTRVDAAVMVVPPGTAVDTLIESPGFRTLTVTAILPLIGVTGPFDEVTKRARMQPIVDLYKWAIEGFEPTGIAPYVLDQPLVTGVRPDVMWQLAEFDETVGTVGPDGLIAALGAPAAGLPYPGANVTPGTLPFRANRMIAGMPTTVGAYRFASSGHGMGYSLDEQSTVETPIIPPFRVRTPAMPYMNPIVGVHGQFQSFFSTRFTTGRAEISAPPAM